MTNPAPVEPFNGKPADSLQGTDISLAQAYQMTLDEQIQDSVVMESDRDEAVYSVNKQYKPIIKQLMVDELEKIIDFIDTDTNDVCWKHSPDDTPMIHSSRVDYLKEYIEQKLEEFRK